MSRKNLDQFDWRLLAILQRDASRTLDVLAAKIALSSAACWRRIQRMREMGIIGPRVDILSQAALGFQLTGFVAIKTDNHSQEWLEKFARDVAAIPEVVEFHRMTGDMDYILKVVATDLNAYNRIYREIIDIGGLRDVSANFSMECIKYTTELPLEAVSGG